MGLLYLSEASLCVHQAQRGLVDVRGTAHERPELGEVGGQVKVQVPQKRTRAQAVHDQATRDVVVQLHVRGNVGHCFGVFVVILLEG